MPVQVYVGNLSRDTTDDTPRQAFSDFGQVLEAKVMKDSDTGRSRGFGLVTFASGQEADAAIGALNEQELDGRRLKVNLHHTKSTPNPADGRNSGGYGTAAGGGPTEQ